VSEDFFAKAVYLLLTTASFRYLHAGKTHVLQWRDVLFVAFLTHAQSRRLSTIPSPYSSDYIKSQEKDYLSKVPWRNCLPTKVGSGTTKRTHPPPETLEHSHKRSLSLMDTIGGGGGGGGQGWCDEGLFVLAPPHELVCNIFLRNRGTGAARGGEREREREKRLRKAARETTHSAKKC